jgi:hypothetical protein
MDSFGNQSSSGDLSLSTSFSSKSIDSGCSSGNNPQLQVFGDILRHSLSNRQHHQQQQQHQQRRRRHSNTLPWFFKTSRNMSNSDDAIKETTTSRKNNNDEHSLATYVGAGSLQEEVTLGSECASIFIFERSSRSYTCCCWTRLWRVWLQIQDSCRRAEVQESDLDANVVPKTCQDTIFNAPSFGWNWDRIVNVLAVLLALEILLLVSLLVAWMMQTARAMR